MKQLNVYGDTNTLYGNASDSVELMALKKLEGDSRVKFFTSNIVNYEATKLADKSKRNTLVEDHKTLRKLRKMKSCTASIHSATAEPGDNLPIALRRSGRETTRRNNEARHKADRCKTPSASGM